MMDADEAPPKGQGSEPEKDAASGRQCAHWVQLYDHDESLIEAVVGFVADGLRAGEPALLLAGTAHRSRLAARLAAQGIELAKVAANRRLVLLDAADWLASAMRGGALDAVGLRQRLDQALIALCGDGARVRAYSELADLLWQKGHREAALGVEALWSAVGRAHSLMLMCAFAGGGSASPEFEPVRHLHDRVLPAEPDPAQQMAGLRRRLRALEAEVAKTRELEQALKEAQRGRERAERERAAALERERSRQWRIHLLEKSSALLAGSLEYEDTLRRVAQLAVPELADWCTLCLIGEDGALRRVAVHHRDEGLLPLAQEYEQRYPPLEHRGSELGAVLRTGQPLLLPRVTDEALGAAAQDEAHLALLRRLGCASCVLAPMIVRGGVMGVLSLIQSRPGRQFGEGDLELAEELARRGAVTIDNARLYRQATRREEARRRQTEQRLDLLIASISDYAVFMLTPKGHIATWNPGAERIKGYRTHEIIGRHFSIFYSEADRASGKCELELAEAARLGRFEDEGWRVRKDGSRFWANVVISAVRDQDGELVGFSKVTRDLTDRMRSERERTARLAAEQASRAKDEFLAMLGHELRNPLAPIMTAVELMKLRGDPGGAREREIIERQAQHMVRLIDDLLDISRITRGKIELKRELLDLGDVLDKAIEIASPLLDERRHHLRFDGPVELIQVEGDEARLAQIFANLLTNAAKYTEPGGHIEVTLWSERGRAVVQVHDDGVGIAPELLPHVFELFVQGHQGAERSAGGLGIGLCLVRSLVSLHGGEVSAESGGAGQGSRFIVRLPLAPPGACAIATVPAPPRVDGDRRRVLVVDDNEDALALLAEALTLLGYEVRAAADGAAALVLARRFVPEVAILDIGLPVMDGYELAERLRQELGAKRPRLIALSGYGGRGDRERSHRAGFDLHLVKPIDALALAEHLAALDASR